MGYGQPRGIISTRGSVLSVVCSKLQLNRAFQVAKFFQLVDVTDDEGAIWDTQGHILTARYWNNSDWRRKIWHRGERSWLNFRGHFGNRGENDCWWHKIVPICQVRY